MADQRELTAQGIELAQRDGVSAEALRVYLEIAPPTAEILGSTAEILACVRECVRLKYEYEFAIKNLDLRYTMSAERLREHGPALRSALEGISARLDKVLDRAIEIDTASASVADLQNRAKMLELVDRFSSQLTLVLVKIVSM